MAGYIITGGPGAGKTSLLEGLRGLHYPCYAEVSRQLIIEEKEQGGGCLPWIDLSCFAKKVLRRMTEDFRTAAGEGPIFFDRGIPDIVAYLRAAGLPVDAMYHHALSRCRYAPTVFFLPPWEDIYVQDSERWQTFEESRLLSDHLRKAYHDAGYYIEELPRCSVEERVTFIKQLV